MKEVNFKRFLLIRIYLNRLNLLVKKYIFLYRKKREYLVNCYLEESLLYCYRGSYNRKC